MISGALLNVVSPLVDSPQPLPPEVERRARWLVLDTLGCAMAGGRSPTVRSWLNQHGLRADPYGTPAVESVTGDLGPAMALTLGACWDEACEGHSGAHGRPGIAVLGALWPMVSVMSISDLLRSVVVGYEVGARMGAALRIAPGMHVDANWPSLGAAAGAACAIGLDPERIVGAVGIAACQLPTSLYSPVRTGDTARNTYLGHAALLGRMAAESAAAGITAPHDAIESFAETAYGREPRAASGGGSRFEILSGYFKEFAAVRHVHYAARCAMELRERLAPERIEALEIWTYPEALQYCAIRDPRTPLQAQFSISFGVAAMLRFGRLDPSVFRHPSFTDHLLRRLEGRVALNVEPGCNETRAARVRLRCSGGEVVEASTTSVRGDPALPWSQEGLREKFLAYSHGTLSGPRAAMLADHLLGAPLSAKVFPPG